MCTRYGVEENEPIVYVGRAQHELPAAAHERRRYTCVHQQPLLELHGAVGELSSTRLREALHTDLLSAAQMSSPAMVDYLSRLTLPDLLKSWQAFDAGR